MLPNSRGQPHFFLDSEKFSGKLYHYQGQGSLDKDEPSGYNDQHLQFLERTFTQ